MNRYSLSLIVILIFMGGSIFVNITKKTNEEPLKQKNEIWQSQENLKIKPSVYVALDSEEYYRQKEEMEQSQEYLNGKPTFTPIFDINGTIYEFDKDNIYKRLFDGTKKRIVHRENAFLDYSGIYFSAYKNENILYIYHSAVDIEYFYTHFIAIDEQTGQMFYYVPELPGSYFVHYVYYIDDGHAYTAFANDNKEIKIVNIEPYGIGKNESQNVNFEVKEIKTEHSAYYDIEIKSFDENRVKFYKDIDNLRYEDNKTGIFYSKKQVLMYEYYYLLKWLIRTFGEIGDEPFAAQGLDYDAVGYTEEEQKKIYTGADPNDKNILSIEEFCKDIK